MKTIEVVLPERMTAEMDALVENGWFADDTEIVRIALWEFVRRNRFALAERFRPRRYCLGLAAAPRAAGAGSGCASDLCSR